MNNYCLNIRNSGLGIYDYINEENDSLFIPIEELEIIFKNKLIGMNLCGLPLRTRSKVVKQKICEVLGYPIPNSFKKTKPRFPGQNFDVYIQKKDNVQIWNEEIDINRRYVFFKVSDADIITSVKIITGEKLVQFDRTGTLTKKYQATLKCYASSFSERDTQNIEQWIFNNNIYRNLAIKNPLSDPVASDLYDIKTIFNLLSPIIGKEIDYINATNERNRGAILHSLICQYLGYSNYNDDGKYPDITNQLLEVKLQTSPTIDLGLYSPEENTLVKKLNGINIYTKDIRYAIFDGEISEYNNKVKIKKLYIVSGEDFNKYFPLFKGNTINKKIQMLLPNNFFD